MKKSFIFLMLIVLVLISGCTLPADRSSDNTAADTTIPREEPEIEENKTLPEAEEEVKPEDSGQKESPKKLAITLYYQDKDGYIIPVTRRVIKQEGIARAAINGIIDNAINREELEYYGLYPVLPAETQVLGLNIKEGTAIIDFNKKLLDYEDEVAERNIISSIVYTLTEFRTIDNVKILVNGHTMGKLEFNADISGTLNRENVLINSDRVNLKNGFGKADVYVFKNVNDKEAYILPVSVEISKTEVKKLPDKVISLLARKYGSDGLYSEVPDEAKLLASSIKGSTLILDFDEAITGYGGGATREEGIFKQILYSAKQIKGIDKVRILINGKTAELPEGTDISKEIPLPAVINDVIDK